jgi:hypothetical protein
MIQTNGTGRIPVARRNAAALTDTPFEVLRRVRPVRLATKDQLLQVSLALEDEALAQGEAAVLLSTFQEAAFFTPATKKRYELIARRAAFVGALARDLGDSQQVAFAASRSATPTRCTTSGPSSSFRHTSPERSRLATSARPGCPTSSDPSNTPSPTTENSSSPPRRA